MRASGGTVPLSMIDPFMSRIMSAATAGTVPARCRNSREYLPDLTPPNDIDDDRRGGEREPGYRILQMIVRQVDVGDAPFRPTTGLEVASASI